MRTIFPLLTASLLLCSCIPPQTVTIDGTGTSSSVVRSEASSSAASEAPIELAIETDETSSSSAATGTGTLKEKVTSDGFLLIGDAPEHALTVFTNYSCAYCREFSRDMLPRLLEEFVIPGKLEIQIVIVPLKKYPNSALEASALLCAAAEGKGLLMHQELTTATARDRKAILAIAKKLVLPTQSFTRCLDAKETKTALAGQQTLIAERGVTLIPEFLINGDKITGLPSYADLRGWINEGLAK